jgi:hypothetical protein
MSPGLRQALVAKSASTVWLLDDDPSVLKATGPPPSGKKAKQKIWQKKRR